MFTRKVLLLVVALAGLLAVVAWRYFGAHQADPVPAGVSPAAVAQVRTMVRDLSPAGEQALLRIMLDSEPAVGREAVVALARRGDAAAHSTLAQVLVSQASAVVRGEAASALGGLPQTEPDQLLVYLAPTVDAPVRFGAVQGLRRMAKNHPQKVRPALRALLPMLSDPEPRMRAWSASVIRYAMGSGFPFDPQADPATQKANLDSLEALLRARKLL